MFNMRLKKVASARLAVVACAHNPSYLEGGGRRRVIQADPGKV
jgi:hypothetical protein